MNIVIFTAGRYPAPHLAHGFFLALGAVNYVIAADAGLVALDEYNKACGGDSLSPDFILGDMDSIRDRGLFEKYKDCPRESFPRDKDYTDTELALMKAREVSESATVVLVGGSGGRSDHFIAVYDSFSYSYHADFWLCEQEYLAYLPEGVTLAIRGLRAEDKVSVLRLTRWFDNAPIKAAGFVWNDFAPRGAASVSNRISKEYLASRLPPTVTAVTGGALVCLPYTAAAVRSFAAPESTSGPRPQSPADRV